MAKDMYQKRKEAKANNKVDVIYVYNDKTINIKYKNNNNDV
ncbi:MAG: hypothetical protein Q4G05_02150 [Clostridia bacterium]|nr:hypothetical protein [Clostridia bacterium]